MSETQIVQPVEEIQQREAGFATQWSGANAQRVKARLVKQETADTDAVCVQQRSSMMNFAEGYPFQPLSSVRDLHEWRFRSLSGNAEARSDAAASQANELGGRTKAAVAEESVRGTCLCQRLRHFVPQPRNSHGR